MARTIPTEKLSAYNGFAFTADFLPDSDPVGAAGWRSTLSAKGRYILRSFIS
jgi:hypothetical protein